MGFGVGYMGFGVGYMSFGVGYMGFGVGYMSFGVGYMQHLVEVFAGRSTAIIHAVQAAPADGSISNIGM